LSREREDVPALLGPLPSCACRALGGLPRSLGGACLRSSFRVTLDSRPYRSRALQALPSICCPAVLLVNGTRTKDLAFKTGRSGFAPCSSRDCRSLWMQPIPAASQRRCAFVAACFIHDVIDRFTSFSAQYATDLGMSVNLNICQLEDHSVRSRTAKGLGMGDSGMGVYDQATALRLEGRRSFLLADFIRSSLEPEVTIGARAAPVGKSHRGIGLWILWR